MSKKSFKTAVDSVFSVEENAAASVEKKKLGKHARIAVKMFHTPVVSAKETVAPAIGSYAQRMMDGLQVYRMLYFVNVLKIDIVYVTLILAMVGIYDVLNNPLMGIAYDRTRTRFGKARPWIVLGLIPYFASTAALYGGAIFLGDLAGNDPQKIVFVFTMLMIQETFSTVYTIPRNNLLSLQSACPKDRIKVSVVSSWVGEQGAQFVYGLFVPAMELINKGIINSSLAVLFALFGTVIACIGIAGNVFLVYACKERIILQPKPANSIKSLFYVFKNKYLLRNFLANLSISWWSNGGYSWDVVTQQEIFGGTIQSFIAYTPGNILRTVSLGFIPKVQKWFKGNTRNALIFLRFWDIIPVAVLAVFAWRFVDRPILIIIIFMIKHIFDMINEEPAFAFEGEMSREIADYTEYVTGERPDGSINIFTDLIGKVMAPVGAMFTVFVFRWTGYDPTLPMLPWAQGSAEVYQKVILLFFASHIVPNLIRTVPYFFYDLVGEKREKMYVELNARRAMMAGQNDGNQALEEVLEAVESQVNAL